MKKCATPGCGRDIPPAKGRSRPRKYCTACRPSWKRSAPPAVVEMVAPERPQGLLATYRDRLQSAERLTTPDGQHVMLLAEMLVAGGHTASGAAALSRELRAAMDAALEGAPTQADWLDELAKRRERKASGA